MWRFQLFDDVELQQVVVVFFFFFFFFFSMCCTEARVERARYWKSNWCSVKDGTWNLSEGGPAGGGVFHTCSMPPETCSNDFGVFSELISRFEFEFCRCEFF